MIIKICIKFRQKFLYEQFKNINCSPLKVNVKKHILKGDKDFKDCRIIANFLEICYIYEV